MKFIIITVLYNERVDNTFVYNTLLQGQKNKDHSNEYTVKSLVFDNSDNLDIVEYNREFNFKENITYVSMKKNVGLSKAYNTGLSMINLDDDSWIIISDQDTSYLENFIENIYEIVKLNNANVLAPIVRNGGNLVSPCHINGKHFVCEENDFNMVDKKKQVFINSGLCINAKLFQKIRYDEGLFLDFVDYDCIYQFINMEIYKPYVIKENIIQQNFSGQTKKTYEADYRRYKIYCRDGIYFYSKWYKKNIFKFQILFARALKLCLIHNNFKFLLFFLKSSKNRKYYLGEHL